MFEEYKIKKIINKKWNTFIESLGVGAENKIKQSFDILEIFPKKYGFDAIVSVPFGKSLVDFRKLLHNIEAIYNAVAICSYSKCKNSIYMRVRLIDIKDSEFSVKDLIRFKFYKSINAYNSSGETYRIETITDIKKPSSEDIVGYKLKITIPNEFEFSSFDKLEGVFNTTLGKCFIEKDNNNNIYLNVITKPLDNNEKYTVMKCKPYELFTAMGYDYKPVFLNFKESQGAIIGGQNGSGKTVSEIMGLLNVALQYGREDIRFIVASISDKQDLRILANLPQCDYYARNLNDSIKALMFLKNESARRSNLFADCSKYTVNGFEYNKTHRVEQKLPIYYFVTDEIADYMEEPHDTDDIKQKKAIFSSLFWDLARKGRSSLCWIVCATQRGDTKNLGANVKAQFGNKVCFYQPNISSAMTIFSDADNTAAKVTKLAKINRECLIENSSGMHLAKSLFLSNKMLEELTKDIYIKNKKYMNLNCKGEVIKEESEEIATEINENHSENAQKEQKNDKKDKKIKIIDKKATKNNNNWNK